jgi:hypothetical protein
MQRVVLVGPGSAVQREDTLQRVRDTMFHLPNSCFMMLSNGDSWSGGGGLS